MVQTAVAGEIDLSITYDPFGEIVSGVDANFVGFAYNGEETNQVTGLQYLRARYYDSDLGSFLTIDSYLGSLTDVTSQNRYTYANNDPVNNIDPSGHYSVNTNGTKQYYQSTGLNDLRDYMTAAGFWAGQVQAQNSFNASVYKAKNTSFMNYQSISGISQATANSYVYNGIAKAGQVSMNYGCSVPTVPNASIAKYESNVNAAKNNSNAQISQIKAQKKTQYDQYQAYLEYLRQLEIARQKALEAAKALKNGVSKFVDGISSAFDKLLHPYCTCPYDGSAADFHRLEQNLPPLGCTCGKPKKPITIKYDRNAAIDYAYNWAGGQRYSNVVTDYLFSKRNSDYYSYTQNCANFVSQCLYNGGMPETSDWYMHKEFNLDKHLWDPRSAISPNYWYDWDIPEAWRLASSQYNYFKDSEWRNGEVIEITNKNQIAQAVKNYNIQKGDLMYFFNDEEGVHHATMISSVTDNMIYYTANTMTRFDEPLSEALGDDGVRIIMLKNKIER